MRSHERPLGEAVPTVVIVRPLAQDHRSGAARRRQIHLQVTASRRVRRNHRLHVLQVVDLGVGAIARGRVDGQQQRIAGRDFSASV